MGTFEDDQFRIVLVGIFVIVDSWKVYLTVRNIRSIKRFSGPPPELDMGSAEFNRMQANMMVDSSYILMSIVLNLGSRVVKLATNYYPFIWALSGNYGETLVRRAVWFSALDACVDKGKLIPVAVVSAVIYGGVDPFLVFIKMTITTAAAAVMQAFGTYFAIVLTEKFGPSGIMKLSLVSNVIGLLVVAVYIGWLVPRSFERLPDDEVGRSVAGLATSVGYPTNTIFVDNTDSLPNAFYSDAVFSKMIIITKSLITSLNAPQLTSVVAHELGHWNYRHPHFQFLESILEIFARGCLWTISYGNTWFIDLYQLDELVHPIVPVLLTDFFVRPPIVDVLRGIFKTINTRFEFAADGYACRVWNANHLRESLVKMSNKAIFDSWFSGWFFGHPSTLDRIQRIDRNFHQS